MIEKMFPAGTLNQAIKESPTSGLPLCTLLESVNPLYISGFNSL